MHATDPRAMKRGEESIKSVDINWEILHTICELKGATAAEISDELEYSKSTIHTHLKALVANRVIIRYTEGNPTCLSEPPAYPIYELSFRFFEMGERTKRNVCPTVVEQELKRLASETGELAIYAIPEYNHAVYVGIERGKNAIDYGVTLGGRELFPLSAFGRAILAKYDDRDLRRQKLLENLPAGCWIETIDDIFDAVSTVRERGYAVDDEETNKWVRTVAAPVTTEGRVLGAIGISGPVSRFSDETIENDLAIQVQSATETISIGETHADCT
jgi:DNA-binding IclR family transcriptional regulator